MSAKKKALPIPEDLAPWLTKAQWRKLALHELIVDDRESIYRYLRGTFEGVNRKDVGYGDIADGLVEIQGLADDYRESFDDTGYDKAEVMAANFAVDQIAREMKAERAAKKKGRRKTS